MTLSDQQLVLLENELAIQLGVFNEKISKYLRTQPKEVPFTLKIQTAESDIKTPNYGKVFGITRDNSQITFGDWVFKLHKRERKSVVDFNLVREVFRLYLSTDTKLEFKMKEFVELVLSQIAILWLFEDLKLENLEDFYSPIRGRMIFEDCDLFKSGIWSQLVERLLYLEISAIELFIKLQQYITRSIKLRYSVKKNLVDFNLWLDSYSQLMQAEIPFVFTETQVEILQTLHDIGYEKGRVVEVAKQLEFNRGLVSNSIKDIYNANDLFWYSAKNLSLLKLYPFRFKVTATTEENRKKVFDYLVKHPYISRFFGGKSKNDFVLYGSHSFPYIVQNKLESDFERLKKKGIIHDHYVQQKKRSIIQVMITSNEEVIKGVSYNKLIDNLDKYNVETIRSLDKTYEFDIPSSRIRIDKKLLGFISLIQTRMLIEGIFGMPVTMLYKFCEEIGINTEDSAEVMQFLYRQHSRCMKNGLLEYYLIMRKRNLPREHLLFDLTGEFTKKQIDWLLDNIITSYSRLDVLHNRIIINFHHVVNDKTKEAISNRLSKNDFSFETYSGSLLPSSGNFIMYDKLYDYDAKSWKIDI